MAKQKIATLFAVERDGAGTALVVWVDLSCGVRLRMVIDHSKERTIISRPWQWVEDAEYNAAKRLAYAILFPSEKKVKKKAKGAPPPPPKTSVEASPPPANVKAKLPTVQLSLFTSTPAV